MNQPQPIICFEGPSGIGKTTLANGLSDDFHIVPEVNLLFERKGNESEYWYNERQVDRYQLCRRSVKPSILDGDIFQPIWYNWACGYPDNFLSRSKTHAFYRNQLERGQMAFPDLYFIFQADVEELIRRKEGDATRTRRNFAKHLTIISPLQSFWNFLDQETELQIHFIDYQEVETTQKEVLTCIDDHTPKAIDQLKLMKQIEAWLKSRP